GGSDVPVRVTHATKGNVTREGDIVAPFDEFKNKYGGIYTLPKDNPFSAEILDTLGGMYPYEYDLFTNANVLDFTKPPKGRKGKAEKAINGLFSRQDKKDIGEATGEGYWDPVRSFYDGELWPDTDRATQDAVIEKLRSEFDAEAIKFNDNPNYGWDSQSVVVFDPKRLKSTSNRGTFNPADPNIYKGIIPAVGAGGLLALMGPEEAEAKPYQFPADKRGTVLYEPGLESPIVDPADILTAPFGVAGAGAKAAAMAAEPFISYGMDKAINGLLGLFSDEEE
ncbi:MAG: hypothetical protein IIV56_06400, partial [Mailhella sp.]|nr:hypothetical protein [Mailhella sp.]